MKTDLANLSLNRDDRFLIILSIAENHSDKL
jgi:hypothetical protein